MTLLVSYVKFKAHFTSMATSAFCSDMPPHRDCTQWDGHLFFNKTVNDYLTKKESGGVLCQMNLWMTFQNHPT